MTAAHPPEAVLLIGIQASGKSRFAQERLFHSHVRINLDMVRTRNREQLLLQACLEGGQPFVVDNTNPSRSDRARYIEAARDAGFLVVGYYFRSSSHEAERFNAMRPENRQVPVAAIRGTSARLELPALDEGFDRLYYVCHQDDEFRVEPWSDAV